MVNIAENLNRAKETVSVGSGTIVALFPVYELKIARENDDYFSILRYLIETDPNANVFAIGDGVVKWRVRRYNSTDTTGMIDPFVTLRQEREGDLSGITFAGNVFRIDVDSGSADKVGWTK